MCFTDESCRDVHAVAVTDVLKFVTASVDFSMFRGEPKDWHYMMSDKACDTSTITLIRVIAEYGFTDPICFVRMHRRTCPNSCCEPTCPNSCCELTPCDCGKPWTIGNGHHRLTVAILTGMDEILADFSSYYSISSTHNDSRVYTMREESDRDDSDWLARKLTDQYRADYPLHDASVPF